MDAVAEIKSRLSIEDVVGQYVELKRSGRNLKGLSPFGNERTPSFMVSPEKQIWHDFSSGKGGDMFSFVMEMEGLDFKGALELLARKSGVDLTQYHSGQGGGSARAKEKERLYEALEAATKFYQVQFSKHRPALEYVLGKRQFSKQTALEWRLGYSPEDGQALCSALQQRGFTPAELQKAGLATQRYRGLGDMFRGRVMIPLADAQGRVVGFTARLLKDDPNAPKYINTPATALYDKSRHVFGLHLAKDAIRQNNYAVVAEGNLDVIASHQAGVRQVVATAGTALTPDHLKTLGRFTPDIRLCFDADKAGVNATERSIPLASKAGVSLSIITIPSGKDPDELVRQSADTWRQVIEQPVYALDWLMARYQKELDVTSAQGKRQFSDVLLAVVRALDDPVEQEHYLAKVGEAIGTSTNALQAKLSAKRGTVRQPESPRPAPQKAKRQDASKTAAELRKLQNHLLAIALARPQDRKHLPPLKPQMVPDEPARELLALLIQNPDRAFADGESALSPVDDYAKMLSLLFEELYQSDEPLELDNEVIRLRDSLIHRYVHIQKQKIARELRSADEQRSQALLEAAKKLDSLLKPQEAPRA